jgi:hypothetical protein
MFGTTKLQAEDVLWQSRLSFGGLLVLRFSYLYGDVFDSKGRIARLVLAARTSQVVDINGSVQLLDLVSVVDATAVVTKAVNKLSSDIMTPEYTMLLVCSGLSTPYDQIVDTVLSLTSSSSPLRQADGMASAGSSFLGDPSLLNLILGVSVGRDLTSGLKTYVSRLLALEMIQLTSLEPRACMWNRLDVVALDGCEVFVTVFSDFADLSANRLQHHVTLTALFRRHLNDSSDLFQLEGLTTQLDAIIEPSDAYYEALYDPPSGGYRLRVRREGSTESYTYNQTFTLSENRTETFELVSIRPYSCSAYSSGSNITLTVHYITVRY